MKTDFKQEKLMHVTHFKKIKSLVRLFQLHSAATTTNISVIANSAQWQEISSGNLYNIYQTLSFGMCTTVHQHLQVTIQISSKKAKSLMQEQITRRVT